MRYGTDTRNTMALAYYEGMHNGDYVFLGLESSPSRGSPDSLGYEIPMNELWQGFTSIQERFIMSDRLDEFQVNASEVAKTLPKNDDEPDLEPERFGQYSGKCDFVI